MCEQSPWLAPESSMLPDFIIAGAMKSGTSSIHAILDQHPDIIIPPEELHFFDMDDICQHPDFGHFYQGGWKTHRLENSPEVYWQWYSDKLNPSMIQQITGEDSTTYLASELAIRRLAMQNKKIKIIIMLRHPTARTYSHYWHMVRAGRAQYSFENTLMYAPQSLLDRSAYLTQLTTLYRYFPKEQVKVVLFEDFLADKSKVIGELCDFVGVNKNSLPDQALDIHANHAKIPRFVWLQLIKAKLFRASGQQAYAEHFSKELVHGQNRSSIIKQLFSLTYRIINPLVKKKPEPIRASTKQYLDQYFKTELQGIDELLEQDVMDKWFGNA